MGNKIDRKELFMVLSQQFTLTDFLVINDSDLYSYRNDTICIFKSFNDIYYLIYQTHKFSIISYNLFKKQKIGEIKNVDTKIAKLQHCFDTNNKRDLLLSFYSDPSIIKVWNIDSLECLLIIDNIHTISTDYFSSCFLKDLNNNIFIIANNGHDNNAKIKVYNLEGNLSNVIKDSNKYKSYFIYTYYDKKCSKIYIISSNDGCIISYIYNENIIKYHKYSYENDENSNQIKIYDNEKIIQLLGAGNDGRIRIWNLHSGKLLYKIKICDKYYSLYDFCFYNGNLIIACADGKMRIVNIKYGVTVVESLIKKYYISSFVKLIPYNNQEYLLSYQKYDKENSIDCWSINS